MAITGYTIPATALHSAFRAQGVDAVTTVPDFVELEFAKPQKFARESPQLEFPDAQFQCMGPEARAMMDALGVTK
jgi:hypothetical protein